MQPVNTTFLPKNVPFLKILLFDLFFDQKHHHDKRKIVHIAAGCVDVIQAGLKLFHVAIYLPRT